MKKICILIVLCIMLFGCSSPQERLNSASSTISNADVVYRTAEDLDDNNEFFILKNDTEMVCVHVSCDTSITKLKRIPIEELNIKDK